MNASSTSSDSQDNLVAEFLRAYLASPEASAVLGDFCGRHPERAAEFRALAEANLLLDQVGLEDGPPVPEQLGEFRVIRRIGQGGMGEVYEAVQESLGRRVAVKIIRQGRVSPDKRERFLREQKVLGQLHQTHIVPIHTAGLEGPLQYFAMPYIDGAALHHVVRTAQRMDESSRGRKTPTLAKLAGLAVRNDLPTGEVEKVSPAGGAGMEEQVSASHTGDSVPRPALSEDRPLDASKLRECTTLSQEYYRSVAEVMADAAEAVHHAHCAGIMHRDLKPSNIMVDRAGACWLIDFGLAAFLNGAAAHHDGSHSERAVEPLTVSGVLGTPQYMAPEQCHGKADTRTDVWGLGVTLYELLTLRRAFDGPSDAAIREKILTAESPSPRRWATNMPLDVVAICRKALRKKAGDRYRTAGDFADDLRRWLRSEPTIARPARAPRRVWLWMKRNKGWTVALLVSLASLFLLTGAAVVLEQRRTATAEQSERVQRRETLIQRAQYLRMSTHQAGWSTKALRLIEDAAELRRDDDLRNYTVATLAGLDVSPRNRFENLDASSVAFDTAGRRLLLGGLARLGKRNEEPAKVWDGATGALQTSQQPGDGPVAFLTDHTPLQLITKNSWTLALWDLDRQRAVSILRLPGQENASAGHAPVLHARTLSGDGTRVAVSVTLANGQEKTLVWDGASGRLLHQLAVRADVLAFAPDNAVLAVGDEEGQLALWPLRARQLPICLRQAGMPIESLAFSHDAKLIAPQDQRDETFTGRLAVGDGSATVTIWDLKTREILAYGRGSNYFVSALAFSPDDTILATGGQGAVKLWDAGSGQSLLELPAAHQVTGLTFSPDGRQFASWGRTTFAWGGGGHVWELQDGRGFRILRGLTGRIEKVRYSPDGRLLTALSHNWQIGIWDADTGRLLFKVDAPIGRFADNVALTFSPDKRCLVFASHCHAKLWDIATGKELRSWQFGPGLSDFLTFDPSATLLSFRVETRDGKEPPFTEFSWTKHPRVCRIRDLKGTKARLIKELWDFNKHVYYRVGTTDGKYIVVEGEGDSPAGLARSVKVFHGLTGKELVSIPSRRTQDSSRLQIDPLGGFFQVALSDDVSNQPLVMSKIELPSGKLLGTFEKSDENTSLTQQYWIERGKTNLATFSLMRRKDRALLVQLGIDAAPNTISDIQFNSVENQLAWGNADGTVTICDIRGMQRRLAEVGLGW
jgi:serine/threonine protein kinase/WD40 repeat protein